MTRWTRNEIAAAAADWIWIPAAVVKGRADASGPILLRAGFRSAGKEPRCSLSV